MPRRAKKASRTVGRQPRRGAARFESLEIRRVLDSTVVFSEIMYRPAANEETLEWLELHNELAVNVELSKWKLAGGIDYTFPQGTLIAGGGYLVVAISPADLQVASGYAGALGPFTGRLSNSGEKLELIDNSGRVMDSVTYADAGDWTTGADGSGASLAKISPTGASDVAASWTFSREIGGTPGALNFAATGIPYVNSTPVAIDGTWRYDDTGVDRGTNWRNVGYDDSAWASGAGLFSNTTAALPAAKNTTLAVGRQTYYFRTTFNFNGDPAGATLRIHPIVDDGAVYYLNGVEVYRQNMPGGAIAFSTVASSSVGAAAYSGPFLIPAAQLVVGSNVLAVEVHDGPTSATSSGLAVTPSAGIALAWDGSDGAFYSPTNPALVPSNIALASQGTVAFGSSQFGAGIHLITNINNGQYGNSNSWISNFTLPDPNPYIGVRFNGLKNVSSFAFGRDNGNTVSDACGGTCTDRSIGTYTVQYTRVAVPGTGTTETGNATTGWATLGTIQYSAASASFTPYLRHNYIVSQGGNPIQATGMRIKVSDPNIAIDELEVNSPASVVTDAAFGAELLLRQEVVDPNPPPKLAFNEIGAVGGSFGIELANFGDASIDLAGWVIGLQRATYSEYVVPAQSIGAGGLVAFTQAQLGFTPAVGDKLFLYKPGKSMLVDATQVSAGPRARQTPGTGAWLAPSAVTLGAVNSFSLHDEVVINEVMYHHRPEQAQEAVVDRTPLLAIGSTWKYQDSGSDLGTTWKDSNYDDSTWSSGAGLLYVETAALPAPKATPLAAGRITYYFRQSFQYNGDPSDKQLELDPLIDDGAVFYLNGVEINRVNMPAGTVNYNTSASSIVSNAAFGTKIVLPATQLLVGNNVLAVEVHQAVAAAPGAGPAISPAAGFAISWDGTDGDYSIAANPANVPTNIALASQGTTAFGSTEYGAGVHLITNINNGQYGNSNSWLSNFNLPDPNPYIGIKFSGLKSVSSIAFGRDNGNTVIDACGGTCTDRSIGTYTIQYTQVVSPGTGTTETGDALTGWVTVGTLNYQGATDGFTPYLRHGYQLSQGGNPLEATGLRIKVSDPNIAIDELEVNTPPDPANFDAVFGANLAAIKVLSPAVPFHESSEAWVELFNRSAGTIDISGWKLSDAVGYTFPVGTTLAAGEYLVVAQDAAALRALYPSPSIRILGNWQGSLSRSSEHLQLTDLAGNPADQVTYYDGGRWPDAADGGGSSLELRDPDSDNNQAESWAASNESSHSAWQNYTYTGTVTSDGTTEEYHEFILGLLAAGEVLLDDISVIEDPAGAHVERIQNGTFEAGNANTWRIAGNHQGSVIVDPDNAANKVLRLVASGPTEDRLNHAETTFTGNAPIQNGVVYQVSFKAKWISGSNQLNSRFYFDRLPETTLLKQPTLSGTPGTVNSTKVANAGPTFGTVQQSKAIPLPGEAVTISTTASDPDGIASMTLWWRLDGGAWQSQSMTPSAAGVYSAAIPGQAAGAVVQFYIDAADSLGAHAAWPAAGVDARALIKFDDSQAASGQAHELRLILTAADDANLHALVNQSSNQLIRGTVVYDEHEVFYNVGVRLQGSPAARADATYVNFAIEFDPDHLFRGVQEEITIDRSGRSGPLNSAQDELLVKHIVTQAGGVPETYDDLVHFIAPTATYTRIAILTAGFNNDLLAESFDNGDEGTLYKMDVPYVPNGTTDGNPESPKIPNPYHHPNVKDLANYGDDKEAYRMHLGIQNNRDRDDFESIIALSKAMSLSGQALSDAVTPYMDVDEWMRTFALQSLTGIADTYTRGGLHHNIDFYTRPSDGKVVAIPYDWDFAFTLAPNDTLVGSFSNLPKLINLPTNLRAFYGHLQDIISTTFNTTYMANWTSHYGQVAGQDYSSILAWIGQRASFVTSQLPASIPFAITTNGGADLTVNTPSVVIQGKGWINVRQIYLADRTAPLDVTWLNGEDWQVTVPLANGVNSLTFNAVDFQGQAAGSDTIQITTNVGQTAQGGLRISELMYHPGTRTPAEVQAGFTDDDDFEFVELTNVGAAPIDLAGVRFTSGINYNFSTSSITSLAPGEFVVVAANTAAFTLRYPASQARLAGQYSGQLNNGGETLVLVDALSQVIQQFTYADLWQPSTDGLGRSLVIINPLGTTASWNDAASWRPSGTLGGSPGFSDPQPGSVVGRSVFYNNSRFDSGDAAANSADDAAIATDKAALLPGGVATLANYTSYSRGINGVMVDIANLGGAVSAADFEFRAGNDNNPAAWALAVAPQAITVRAGAGPGGASRVTLVWPDLAITGKWLQVTVKATAATNLVASDVFYFGNAVGETGDSAANAIVNSTDEIAARGNGRTFNNLAPVTFAYDFNRDGFVNATDQILARSHSTTLATSLKLIAPPAAVAPQVVAAAPVNSLVRAAAVGADKQSDQLVMTDLAVGLSLAAAAPKSALASSGPVYTPVEWPTAIETDVAAELDVAAVSRTAYTSQSRQTAIDEAIEATSDDYLFDDDLAVALWK